MNKSFRKFASHKNKPVIFERAAAVRQSGSIVEKTLWKAIREQTKGADIKIRYQLPFHPYIADFACPAAKLIIEVDGISHDSSFKHDQKRTAHFECDGFEVIRFANADVMKDPSGVATMIIEYAIKRRDELWRQNPSPRALKRT